MRMAGICFLLCAACGGTLGDGENAPDGGSNDGSTTVDVASDAFDADATVDVGDGGCPTPADISGFTPQPLHPEKILKGSCTTQQIDDFFKACVPNKGYCKDFIDANATCAGCLSSYGSDATWGAIVHNVEPNMDMFNAAGCIAAVTGDTSSTSCAQKYDDVSQCIMAACYAQCPLTTPEQDVQFELCTTNAAKTVCASYVASECGTDAGFYEQCIASGSNDPEASFDAIGAAMCGP